MPGRPTGREKHVTSGGQGVYRREKYESGGPVGREQGAGKQSSQGTGGTYRAGSSGGSYGGGRGSGGGGLLRLIIIGAIILLGGGGGGEGPTKGKPNSLPTKGRGSGAPFPEPRPTAAPALGRCRRRPGRHGPGALERTSESRAEIRS